MERFKFAAVGFVLLVSLTSGCAMCSSPFDECYAAFGGSRPRADMLAGRVGSKFAEAGAWSEGDAVEMVEVPQQAVEPSPEYYDEFFDNQNFDSVNSPDEKIGFDLMEGANELDGLDDPAVPDVSLNEAIEEDLPESTFDPLSVEDNPLR